MSEEMPQTWPYESCPWKQQSAFFDASEVMSLNQALTRLAMGCAVLAIRLCGSVQGYPCVRSDFLTMLPQSPISLPLKSPLWGG